MKKTAPQPESPPADAAGSERFQTNVHGLARAEIALGKNAHA